MLLKHFLLAAPFVIAFPATAITAQANWHWVWTTPDYNRSDNSRTWSTANGTAVLKIVGSRFRVHLEDDTGEPNFNLTGLIMGRSVTATVLVMDTDDVPRYYVGAVASDHGATRITLTSADGDFIGLIAVRPSSRDVIKQFRALTPTHSHL